MTSNGNGSSLISLRGVKKVFFTDEVETHALDDVHFEISKGEYVAISGPSGCGKTTLLSILGLLDTPSAGEYTLAGQSVARLAAVERAQVRNRQIGFIFQAFNLIGDLSVFENVELPLTYRDMPASERRDRVAAALERVEMSRADAGQLASKKIKGHRQHGGLRFILRAVRPRPKCYCFRATGAVRHAFSPPRRSRSTSYRATVLPSASPPSLSKR